MPVVKHSRNLVKPNIISSRLDHVEKLEIMMSWWPSWIFFRKRKQHKMTQDIHICTYKFQQDPTIFTTLEFWWEARL